MLQVAGMSALAILKSDTRYGAHSKNRAFFRYARHMYRRNPRSDGFVVKKFIG